MKQIVFWIFLIPVVFSCNNNDKNETPVEVPISDYSFIETSCQWVNLKNDEVIIVNSEDELAKYINSEGETPPEIDFSKYTLLLANGVVAGGIANVNTTLFKNYTDTYTLNVTILLDFTMIAGQFWSIAILVPKIPETAVVTLDIETYR